MSPERGIKMTELSTQIEVHLDGLEAIIRTTSKGVEIKPVDEEGSMTLSELHYLTAIAFIYYRNLINDIDMPFEEVASAAYRLYKKSHADVQIYSKVVPYER